MKALSVPERLRLIGKAMVGLFDDQAWTQAEGLLSGVIGPVGAPPERGTREFLNGYSTMPWMRAIAGKIAFTFASTRWKLLVVRQRGRAIRAKGLQRSLAPHRRAALLKSILKQPQTEMEEILEHPFLDALYNANGYQTGLGLRYLMMIYIDLVGDCFLLKERNGVGAPVGLWPIPPHWVTTTPSVSSPVYEISYRGWQRSIADTDILWLNNPNPTNPYGRGVGHAMAIADELETDEYAAKMVKTIFFNRARPDLLISPKEGVLQAEDVQRLEQHWNTRLQGFHRMFKPFFMRRAVEVKEFNYNLKDLNMKELRDQDRDIIMQVWGVPPEIFGVLENSNRATIEAAEELFSRHVLVPRLEFVREQLQERLLPEYDPRLILDYESPVTEDKEFQLKAREAAPWTQSVDEWRELQGLAPSDQGDGNLHAVPFNVSFVDNLTEAGLPDLSTAQAPMVEQGPPDEVAAGYRPLRHFTTRQIQAVRDLIESARKGVKI